MFHMFARAHWRAFSAVSIFVLLAVALPLSLFTPPPALGASTWVVTSLDDDGEPDTLRYAVDNSEDGDIISFASDLSGTITLGHVLGQLVIDHPLTIEGPGAGQLAISGANETRVFLIKGPQGPPHVCSDPDEAPAVEDGCCSSEDACAAIDVVEPGRKIPPVEGVVTVSISGLTIRDGSPKFKEPFPCHPVGDNCPWGDEHGPGCYGGNVLCVSVNVEIIDCVIKNGLAEQGGGLSARNHAILSLEGCSIYNNVAGKTESDCVRPGHRNGSCPDTYNGGGLDFRNNTTVTLRDCTVRDNTAQQGAGINVRTNTDLVMADCAVYDNTALDYSGGGIDARNGIDIVMEDCTVRDNAAQQEGGGIAARNHTVIGMEDCDILDNTAQGEGGGIAARNHTVILMEDCDILDNTAQGEGGGIAIRSGGDSSANGRLTLTRCSVSGNEGGPIEGVVAPAELEPTGGCCKLEPASGGGCKTDQLYGGGGIFAKKLVLLSVTDCVIADNVVHDDEQKLAAGGGILLKRTPATISGSTISGNEAGTGMLGGFAGGIACLNSEMEIRTCSIVNNSAGYDSSYGVGGGIYVGQGQFSSPGGDIEPGKQGEIYPVEITDSVIAGNTAGSRGTEIAAGGGIAMGRYEFLEQELLGNFLEPVPEDVDPESGLDDRLGTVLTNCTISGNAATNSANTSSGGGITNTGGKKLALNFCTVTRNRSSLASGLSTLGPDETEPSDIEGPCEEGKLHLKNSIVAGNPCGEGAFEIEGFMVSWEGNVLCPVADIRTPEPGNGCYNGGCGDITIIGNPLLGPLADNGGPTMTHALLPGSPAIDAACDCLAIGLVFPTSSEPATVQPVTITTDQRGSIRPVDGYGDGEAVTDADAGAYESQPDIALPDIIGGSLNAGQAYVGDCELVRVRVTNEGAAALVIGETLILDSNVFSLVGDYSGIVLLGGESMWVELLFCPRLAGVSAATLRIMSNDPDEAPLEVTLVGLGLDEHERPVEPASMTTNYFVVDPQQVLPGQEVTMSANVCNNGGSRGSYTASLSVNGAVEQSQSVTVSPDSCKLVTFKVARAVPGTYQVSVNGMYGQFTVLAPRTVQSSVPSQQDTELGTAGIIAIIVVVLVLIGALVFIFRSR